MQPHDPERPPPGAYLRCDAVVELITDHLEGALSLEQATLVDEHLSVCVGCASIRDQWLAVADLTARTPPSELDALAPSSRAQLLAAFRGLADVPPSSDRR